MIFFNILPSSFIESRFSGEHKIFIKPEIGLNPSPVNTKFF